MLKNFVKKILPKTTLKKIRPFWHGFLASAAAFRNGFPSKQLVVIGITGTAGKSTTVQMLAKIMNDSGLKTGYVTTVGYSVNGDVFNKNKISLSMPSGPVLQSRLLDMVDAGCKYAVIEATSEGLAQNRHFGIDFDVALLTNLHPAHLDSHGDFESYKRAKGRLFKAISASMRKEFFPTKIIGLNLDSADFGYFSGFKADKKFAVTSALNEEKSAMAVSAGIQNIYALENIKTTAAGSSFKIYNQEFNIGVPGEFNIWNALLAVSAANMFGVELAKSADSLVDFKIIGRMEEIDSPKGFKVFIDYAPEPIAMENSLQAVSGMPHKRVVHVFGSTGGHRDVGKRQEFGKISATYADKIIITNDDVYESDPIKIAEEIKNGIDAIASVKNIEVKTILDRGEAIKTAIAEAEEGDIILITGKGSENFLVLPGDKRIDWDEHKLVETLLR
jgi:UDP-N-acetylmuramoyl-L-alanyl-D-glutamate--2,6-diaminopimelate ligase